MVRCERLLDYDVELIAEDAERSDPAERGDDPRTLRCRHRGSSASTAGPTSRPGHRPAYSPIDRGGVVMAAGLWSRYKAAVRSISARAGRRLFPMAEKKKKTARLNAARKRKARKKQERKSGHKRAKGGRKRR